MMRMWAIAVAMTVWLTMAKRCGCRAVPDIRVEPPHAQRSKLHMMGRAFWEEPNFDDHGTMNGMQ